MRVKKKKRNYRQINLIEHFKFPELSVEREADPFRLQTFSDVFVPTEADILNETSGLQDYSCVCGDETTLVVPKHNRIAKIET